MTEPDTPPGTAAPLPGGASVHAEATRAMRVVIVESFVVLLIALAVGWVALQQHSFTHCQVHYNVAYARVQQQRTALANESNSATTTLINTVFTTTPHQTQAQRTAQDLAAYVTYKSVQRAVAAGRAAHPLPDPPTC